MPYLIIADVENRNILQYRINAKYSHYIYIYIYIYRERERERERAVSRLITKTQQDSVA